MNITKASHLDHGLFTAHIRFLLERFGDQQGFRIETVDLPEELPAVDCALFGPIMGDPPVDESEVTYVRRGERAGDTRTLRYRAPRRTRKLTVIMGPDAAGTTVLYTAYGGPQAPREPFDPSLDDAGREESRGFWSEHALAAEFT